MKKLGFGCMRLPLLENGEVDIKLFSRMVDAYMENGFTYFDTAYKYCGGKSEPALKEALVDRYPRESYVLTTKLSNEFMHTKEEQERIFSEQLSRLGVDYFDYYLIHNQGTVNYRVSLELDSFSFLKEKKKEGKIRHIGISYHDNAELLDEILTKHPEIEVVQLQINYLDWDNETIQSRKCLEVANRHQKPVIVMEPCKGGRLAVVSDPVRALLETVSPHTTPAAFALRFAASQKGVFTVLSGMNTIDQLKENMAVLGDLVPMGERELSVAQQAAKQISEEVMIPCTGCGYCTVNCPKKIPIPEYFSLFQQGYFTTQVVYYFNLIQSHAKAGECVGCDQCEKHCPQHIPIRKHLKEIADRFDSFAGWQ